MDVDSGQGANGVAENKKSVIDLRDMGGMPRLRADDLTTFFAVTGRSEECPFCSYSGAWDLHVDEEQPEEALLDNPRLSVYRLAARYGGTEPHDCVAITCPQCGHFSMISIYRIQMLKLKENP